MVKLKKILLLYFVMNLDLAYSGPNEDLNQRILTNTDPKWYRCLQTDDCGIVSGACAVPIAVNKLFVKEVGEYIYKKGLSTECVSTWWPRSGLMAKSAWIRSAS